MRPTTIIVIIPENTVTILPNDIGSNPNFIPAAIKIVCK